MFRSMKDGEISVSPYDTAWVALVPALYDPGQPQFPSALQWIIDHQLADGSWGDPQMFLIRERILNTIACVIALKKWNTVPRSMNKGRKANKPLVLPISTLSWFFFAQNLLLHCYCRFEFSQKLYSKDERGG